MSVWSSGAVLIHFRGAPNVGDVFLFAAGAVGAVALVAQIPSWAAWPLSMFAATTLYLLGATVQLAAVTSRRRSLQPAWSDEPTRWRADQLPDLPQLVPPINAHRGGRRAAVALARAT